MKSKVTASFLQNYGQLPPETRALVRKSYKLWLKNPHHPGLEFKKLRQNPSTWSARASIHHRVVGVMDGDTVIWYFVGNHRDYEKLIRNL